MSLPLAVPNPSHFPNHYWCPLCRCYVLLECAREHMKTELLTPQHGERVEVPLFPTLIDPPSVPVSKETHGPKFPITDQA